MESSESGGRHRLGHSLDESRALAATALEAGVDACAGAEFEAAFPFGWERNGAGADLLAAAAGLLSLRNSFESFKLPFIFVAPPPLFLPPPL